MVPQTHSIQNLLSSEHLLVSESCSRLKGPSGSASPLPPTPRPSRFRAEMLRCQLMGEKGEAWGGPQRRLPSNGWRRDGCNMFAVQITGWAWRALLLKGPPCLCLLPNIRCLCASSRRRGRYNSSKPSVWIELTSETKQQSVALTPTPPGGNPGQGPSRFSLTLEPSAVGRVPCSDESRRFRTPAAGRRRGLGHRGSLGLGWVRGREARSASTALTAGGEGADVSVPKRLPVSGCPLSLE